MPRMMSLMVALTLLALPVFGATSNLAQWDPDRRQLELEPYASYWVDSQGKASLEDVLAMQEGQWRATSPTSISHGYVDEPYWFRVSIRNTTDRPTNPYLQIGYPVLNHINLYRVENGRLAQQWQLGNKLPFNDRPFQHRDFVVPFEMGPGETLTLYLRVETDSSMQLPLTLWTSEAFQAYEQTDMLFQGIYYGIALAMVLYHLFVYFALRERTFLYYVGYITAMPLFLATLGGLSYQYLWPGATWWSDQLMLIFLNTVLLLGTLFTVRFLSITRNNHRFFHYGLRGLAITAGLMIVVGLFVPFGHIVLPSILLAFVACCAMLVVGVVRLLHRDPAARYYTLAWFFMLFGGIILALNKFALVPNTLFTANAVQAGSALGVILLSIAIADRLNKEKQTAFEAQQLALREEKNARLAQAETLKVQEEANTQLEERVRERTEALEEANSKLLEFSATDALTGLRNRGHFEERFPSACVDAFRHQRPLALLVLDIDRFKSFNDTYGHLIGDECLKMVAQLIAEIVTRPQDLVARFGGEEFVIILPNTDETGAVSVAERIRNKVQKTPFRVSHGVVQVTLSVGITSRVPESPEIGERLFEEADQALYRAKEAGRNRIIVHRPDVADTSASCGSGEV